VLSAFTMETTSPDKHGQGLLTGELAAQRYDGHTDDPLESAGLLRALMPGGVRVLDVGCGTGSVTLIANRGKGNEVVGIEPDAQRAAIARSRGITTYCDYLGAAFFAEHGRFDVIVFADVLEHLAEPAGMLDLALQGLRSGGSILISVPNAVHWTMRWQLLRGRFDYRESGIRDATHLRWFTRHTLEQLLASRGLKVDDWRYSAGTTLWDYAQGWLGRMRPNRRNRLIYAGLKRWPLLFACQHVVKVSRQTEAAAV
jgi:2-polyprenyl-3-methyl-5-hydroxy-6-metoxy-1,4-benzoquinol methylase